MEYIFIIIAMLIFAACIVSIFLENEKLESVIIYEKGKFLKIIKYDNLKAVNKKVYNGKIADIIYKIFYK